MKSDLLELKNLGFTTVNWLHMIGINKLEQLAEMGAVEAYILIRQRDIKVSKVALYALHGALTDSHWSELDEATKQQLLQQVERRELEIA